MRKQIKIQACSSPSIEDALILFPSYTLEVMERPFPGSVFSPTRKKARALKYALAAGFASQIRLPLMS